MRSPESEFLPLSAFAAARVRFAQNRYDACRAACERMRIILGTEFDVRELGLGALGAVEKQWNGSLFDWSEIHRVFREPDCLKIAIWINDRLSALALATTSGQSLRFRFLEGDPRADCPLRGRRILIALEVMANYAQLRGKRELVLEPVNERLVSLYENTYGFEVVRPRRAPAYCRKGL